jgi:hypothetical protein
MSLSNLQVEIIESTKIEVKKNIELSSTTQATQDGGQGIGYLN